MLRLATPTMSVLAVAGASLALAACGSSDSSSSGTPTTAAAGAQNGTARNADFQKYQQCLKDNGVYVWMDLHVGRPFRRDAAVALQGRLTPFTAGRTVRVFQVATGNVGAEMVARIVRHPDLELVGLHCYTPEKIGRDAGELAGLDPIGVMATGTVADIIGAASLILSDRAWRFGVAMEF